MQFIQKKFLYSASSEAHLSFFVVDHTLRFSMHSMVIEKMPSFAHVLICRSIIGFNVSFERLRAGGGFCAFIGFL